MASYHLINFTELNVPELINYIINKHHGYSRALMTNINHSLNRLTEEDFRLLPKLEQIKRKYQQFSEEFDQNMRKEEKIFFPFVTKLFDVVEGRSDEKIQINMIESPMNMLKQDHLRILTLMRDINLLSNHFETEDNNSNACTVFFAELFELDLELRKHIYLEEKILFPKITGLQKKYYEKIVA